MPNSERDVLVVEDDLMVRLAMETVLTDVGYNVETTAEVAEAVRLLSAAKPRLIICDLVMPGPVSSARLARLASERKIPFILASGIPCLRERAAGWTVADWLEKPFTGEQLLEAVGRCLGEGELHPSWAADDSSPMPSTERSSALECTPSLA
jgi:DNA-binding NtrC family response regulator